MRIGAISDIHADSNGEVYDSFIDRLLKILGSKKLDVLIIPGDIGGRKKSIIEFFQKSQQLDIPYKFYVPGNHDLWTNNNTSSWEYYLTKLPEICSAYGWKFLPQNPIKINSTLFIGSPGWYDYSTRNKTYDNEVFIEDYKVKYYQGARWMDAEYIHFGMSDEQVSKMFLDQLVKDFENSILDDVKSVVCVTHIVPFKKFVLHKKYLHWDFFSAFIGNISIGEFIKKLPVEKKHAIFGHTHFPSVLELEDGLTAHCVPLGYQYEIIKRGDNSLEDAIERSLSVFEIN